MPNIANDLTFPVCEKFVSINGEGRRGGSLAVFIRFRGCNLNCSYCDTRWANNPSSPAEMLTCDEICGYIESTGIENITLTGGEPLLQKGIGVLMGRLKSMKKSVEAETNGAVSLADFAEDSIRPDCFTLDYKLPSSGMESKMLPENYDFLKDRDCVKFVSGSKADLERALEIIEKYNLTERCPVYFSPVYGSIEPREIVDFMKEHRLNGVNLQIQLHKAVWEPDRRGV